MNNLKIFPYILMRIAAAPFDDFQILNSKKAFVVAQSIIETHIKLQSLQQSISDILFTVIQSVPDEMQKLVLNVKRDIFNGRNLTSEKIAVLYKYLPEKYNADINEYLRLKGCLQNLHTEGELVFIEELTQHRLAIKDLVLNENFQKGLLLSSQSLLTSIRDHYLSLNVDALSKKDRNTEKGIIKYLSRMYAKTTPYSTFTNIAMATMHLGIDENSKENIFIAKDLNAELSRTSSHIRLNNGIYKYFRTLLSQHFSTARLISIRSNPTIRQDGSTLVFLKNDNNIETFQRIPANQVIVLLLELLNEKDTIYNIKSLAEKLITNEYIDATIEEMEMYIQQMIVHGVFEYNFNVSGTDPYWDEKLSRELIPVAKEIPLIEKLRNVLLNTRILGNQYSLASLENRKHLLQEAVHNLNEINSELILEINSQTSQEHNIDGIDTLFTFKQESLFYEDTALNADLSFNQKDILAIINPLHKLLQEVRLFDEAELERLELLDFFQRTYGKDSSIKIDLLTFYEDYARASQKSKMEQIITNDESNEQQSMQIIDTVSINSNSQSTAELTMQERKQRYQRWVKVLTENIKKSLQNKETVDTIEINYDLIRAASLQVPIDAGLPSHTKNSFGAFIQFYIDNNSYETPQLYAITDITLGYGKMMSRFLHIFDNNITKTLQDWNEGLARNNMILAENTDASYHNANLHPPLMPYEIRIPGGHNYLPPIHQIPVSDIIATIRNTNEKEELILVRASTGQEISVFDLGFLGLPGRSELFKVLQKFSIKQFIPYSPIIEAANQAAEELKNTRRENLVLENQSDSVKEPANYEVIVQSRIIYENKLILRRKTWYIPPELLPIKQPKESDWSYFYRVNEWRSIYKIPEEVFISIFPLELHKKKAISEEVIKRISQDDYKPQYIAFTNPLLVQLFEKLIVKVPNKLKIVEMLPNSKQMLKMNDRSFATECIIQCYYN